MTCSPNISQQFGRKLRNSMQTLFRKLSYEVFYKYNQTSFRSVVIPHKRSSAYVPQSLPCSLDFPVLVISCETEEGKRVEGRGPEGVFTLDEFEDVSHVDLERKDLSSQD